MTPIEQALTQAIAAGYEPKLERFAEIEGATALQIAMAMQADVFLDPDFWRALGRARRWPADDAIDPKMSMGEWQKQRWLGRWHAFVDHLAAGKDAESWFGTLTNRAS
jgi:hypothetical protein